MIEGEQIREEHSEWYSCFLYQYGLEFSFCKLSPDSIVPFRFNFDGHSDLAYGVTFTICDVRLLKRTIGNKMREPCYSSSSVQSKKGRFLAWGMDVVDERNLNSSFLTFLTSNLSKTTAFSHGKWSTLIFLLMDV